MVEADQRAAGGHERLMNVGAALVANRQPSVPVQSGQRPFH